MDALGQLLEIYRVVTSTDIRLIETPEEADDGEDTAFTDVSCTTTDSITGKQFHFDLGVPGDDDDEIEYLPSETPSTDVKVPSYFQVRRFVLSEKVGVGRLLCPPSPHVCTCFCSAPTGGDELHTVRDDQVHADDPRRCDPEEDGAGRESRPMSDSHRLVREMNVLLRGSRPGSTVYCVSVCRTHCGGTSAAGAAALFAATIARNCSYSALLKSDCWISATSFTLGWMMTRYPSECAWRRNE